MAPSFQIPNQSDPGNSPKMLRPTVFWRIADDIPASLMWSLAALSLGVPFLLWWMLSNSGWV
ncbi:MAG: hypothetical protein VKJ46_06220, partial [Leptolyngbyaceae bacterium]|nr:hypothetical protein [Leptolyngbyaceae bacterium]